MKTNTLPHYGAAVLRVAIGFVMLAHAAGKILVFTLPGSVAFFAQHGFPGWTAYPVILAELLGGALLVAGLKTRWVSALLIPIMIGATLVHLPNGWMFTAPGGGWEYPVFLIFALGAQVLLGDGAWALANARKHTVTPGVPAIARRAARPLGRATDSAAIS